VPKNIEPTDDDNQTDDSHDWNNYINFFVALFFFLFFIGTSEKCLNSMIFCGIAFFLSAMCFYELASLTDYSGGYTLMAIFANFIAW
jgi:ABC-type Na+ efflux pump permease subunit